MNDIIGIVWYSDELAYRRARTMFADAGNMPATYRDWKALVEKELEMIKGAGNIALRVDIEPEAFARWCASRGLRPDSQGRTDYVTHVEIEYQKTGKGTIIE